MMIKPKVAETGQNEDIEYVKGTSDDFWKQWFSEHSITEIPNIRYGHIVRKDVTLSADSSPHYEIRNADPKIKKLYDNVCAIASSSQTAENNLNDLLMYATEPDVWFALLENPNTPEETIDALAKIYKDTLIYYDDLSFGIRTLDDNTPNISDYTRQNVRGFYEVMVAYDLSRMAVMPSFKHYSEEERMRIFDLENKIYKNEVSPEEMDRLARCEDIHVQRMIASNPNALPETLNYLTDNKGCFYHLLKNEALSSENLEKVAQMIPERFNQKNSVWAFDYLVDLVLNHPSVNEDVVREVYGIYEDRMNGNDRDAEYLNEDKFLNHDKAPQDVIDRINGVNTSGSDIKPDIDR